MSDELQNQQDEEMPEDLEATEDEVDQVKGGVQPNVNHDVNSNVLNPHLHN